MTPLDPPADAERVLAGLDLLAPVSTVDIEVVASVVDWWSLDAGAELFHEGDPAADMFLVVRGRLESFVDSATPGEISVLGEVARGGTVGEMAILIGGHRTASVRAVRDSVLVRLPEARVALLAEKSPQIALGLARLVAARATRGPRPLRSAAAPATVAVINLDKTGAATALADAVSERLTRLVSVRRVTGADIEAWVRAGGPTEVTGRLADAEDEFDVVLLSLPDLEDFVNHEPTGAGAPSARGSDDERAQRADIVALVLRQMDTVVAVAEASGRPDPEVLELLGGVRRPVSIVIEHRTGRPPLGTRRWLEVVSARCEVRGHTHVRAGDTADLDRLARTLIGRSIGVVLGGGGSRGFAHIGVLRAMREAGICVDRVGGSSMGAIMGAQVAMGWTPDEMLERNIESWSKGNFVELNLPTLSLLRGRAAIRILDEFFGDRQIEDLWYDYFCTTVDLSSCRLHVAGSGSVAEWVRASATVPGLWPPLVDDDGHLHVDGGMLDNVPTDIMRSSHVGSVIGVDVCHRQSAMRVPPDVPLPNGLSLVRARRRARARGEWFPSIFDVLNRSNLLASLQQHEQAERYADLYMTPPAEDQGFAAFDRVGEIADIGYRYAVDILEATDLRAFG
jgi:NTE family protein